MGMYTSVYLGSPNADVPEVEIQFKTGGDDCGRYHTGDTVDWWVDENRVGCACLLDDVYAGESGSCRDADDPTRYWWVCIKDHRIVQVREQDGSAFSGKQCDGLREKWDIPREDPRELWTEAAWAQYEEAKAVNEEAAARDEADGFLPINSFTRKMMRQPGFFRQIFPGADIPTMHTRKDGVVLRRGMTYNHFGRPVVLTGIYTDTDELGVCHLKGTYCTVPAEELNVLEPTLKETEHDIESAVDD